MKKPTSILSRRLFLTGAAGVLAAPMVLRSAVTAAKSNSLTVTSSGGSFQEILVKVVIESFTRETGIKVDIAPRPDMAKVKAQKLTGNVEIDVHLPTAAEAAYGSTQGFWEKLDLSMFNIGDMVIPPTSDVLTTDTFAGGIAWDPSKYGPGKHPTNFAEYFDLEKFPGRRTLRNYASETLEAALLGDGVAPHKIYPLDLDRAFKVLDRIKPSIASWTAATPQTYSLLQAGEVAFSYTYANRAKATNEPGGGTPVAFSFEQNLLSPDPLVVLKGAPNKENAMKYLAYYMRPDVLVRQCNLTASVPNSKKAMSMLSAETRKWMPDMNNPNNLILDGAYWADNLDAVSRRFKEWILT
ncbi:extracellular solute-binding protein [Bradyrhizobium acaciae]|uniref:extracellular solute-binding protein n=1 Tax=Bradyrhizobium acaciae TaxID=2683706 RepID=UPI001E2E91A8|nr:extracellular solute-binding protein [Bradyrhizobium acaciae]MCC8984545.1 extracellular solute-binding protein [Bradyrhizobium acaciae]